MSCTFNSELPVAAFWTDHPQGIPPCVFGFSPGEFPFPDISMGGNPISEDIPIPQKISRHRAPIPPGTKCWFAGFIFCFERPKALSDYDLNNDVFFPTCSAAVVWCVVVVEKIKI